MKRLFSVLCVLALTVVIAHAADNNIAGVVTNVGPGTIEVKTDTGETRSVTTDTETEYMKWILQKPWGQDPRADADFLKVGKRVQIELVEQYASVARTVWIVVGRVGFE